MITKTLDKKDIQIDYLTKEVMRLQKENAQLFITRFKSFNNEECWIYQEDGDNYLESLSCPVVISAQKLMELGG